MDAQTQEKTTSLIVERVHSLYHGMPLSIGITLILEILLTLSHWNVIGSGDLILWNILMLCTLFLRTVTWFFWRNTGTSFSAYKWLICFRAGAVLAGIAWGCASYFMFASYNTTYQALLAFTLAGVASGSLTSLVIDKFSAVAFVIFAIVPLSIRLHAEHGQIAVSMSIMVALFIVFVLSATNRARKQLETTFAQNERLIEWGNERFEQQQMSKLISQAQTLFIANNDNNTTFGELLENIANINTSSFGFIAEVIYVDAETPYLNMLATSNIKWDENSAATYEQCKTQEMKLTNLHTLFGAALITGKAVISNSPATDMRAGKTPIGHPTLTAFLGIPIFNNLQQVAMLGLANKKEGYSQTDIDALKPITQLISQFMLAIGHRRQHITDEENIKRHAKHTKAILEGAFDGIITVNNQGIITSFNHAAEVIFGYRAEQIISNNLLQLIPCHNRHLMTEPSIMKSLKERLGMNQEIIGLRKNGKEFEMELAFSLIDHEGEPSYVGIIRDISNRKYAEKLKNEFIAKVSHELRTPLTSISASLAIIESGALGSLPEKINNLIKISKQNSLRLKNLIDDLLDMEKLLSNTIELELNNFDAVELVQKTLSETQYLAEKYHVKFRTISAENNCIIYADKNRTQQVLTYLLSNAAKFSNLHTNVDISIATNRDRIKIIITDYGVGIAPEFKENIFKKFSQEDNSNTRQKDGSGIGLSISKELIEKMNGAIGFTSSLGKGSSFYFDLPKAHH